MEIITERQAELLKNKRVSIIIDDLKNWFEVIDGLRSGLYENIIEPEKYAYQITKVIGVIEPKIKELEEAYYEETFNK